jgi:hypothetical protein
MNEVVANGNKKEGYTVSGKFFIQTFTTSQNSNAKLSGCFRPKAGVLQRKELT